MNIKELRAKIGLSQQELANKTGIPRPRIAKWEEGKGNPKAEDYKTLENFFENYREEISNPITLNQTSEPISEPYFVRRRNSKNSTSKPYMVPLIPVKAQAGYVRAVDQQTYLDTLEQYALPPGVDPRGANWAYWEVEGDSMEPAFRAGDVILTSQVHPYDWENLRNFYLYVIVTRDTENTNTTSRVLFKRIYCKNQLEWVLISENEENYPQQLLPVEYIKEVWVYRRSIVTKAPPTKMFEIKV